MEDQTIIYIGAGGLALVLYCVITRWAHEIHKRNRYMEAQIKLLSKIAENNGVSKDEIEVINRVAIGILRGSKNQVERILNEIYPVELNLLLFSYKGIKLSEYQFLFFPNHT